MGHEEGGSGHRGPGDEGPPGTGGNPPDPVAPASLVVRTAGLLRPSVVRVASAPPSPFSDVVPALQGCVSHPAQQPQLSAGFL